MTSPIMTSSTPDTPRRADPLNQMTARGSAYCFYTKAKSARRNSDGDMEQLDEVLEAYDRLRTEVEGRLKAALYRHRKKMDIRC